jgi:methylase of polypeptide subunit release factors
VSVVAEREVRKKSLLAVPANVADISQDKLNIENRTRTNLFAWNGQFSPQLIEAIVEHYASSDDKVLDPFAGSGTTLYECARKGISVCGTELNPAAYYMGKVYQICCMKKGARDSLIDSINTLVNTCMEQQDLVRYLVDYCEENRRTATGSTAALLIILLDIFHNDVTRRLLYEKWSKLREIIRDLPYSAKPVVMELGDARHLKISDSTIDLVITSPPYINVFNYHQNYRRSVEALGHDVLGIAKQEFGSNRKNRGNRLYTVVQYCIDMALAVQEMARVCSSGARIVLIVGRESNVLGYSFYNSELIYEICHQVLDFDLELRQERVFKNRFGQLIYEDILHFSNDKECLLKEESVVVEEARRIAKQALIDKLAIENKNRGLLQVAIEKAHTIQKSEDNQ